MYSGKSYILERIRARWDMSKEKLLEETKIRVEILEWMREKNVRSFKEVAAAIAQYSEKPEEFMQKIRMPETRDKNKKDEIDYKIEEKGLGTQNNDTLEGKLERKKNNFWFRKKSKEKKVKRRIRKK